MTEHVSESSHADAASNATTVKNFRRAALAYGLAAVGILGILLWSLFVPNSWPMYSNVRIVIPVGYNQYHVTERQWRRAFSRSMSALSKGEQIALQAIERDVQKRVSDAFQLPKERVKDAADWYYSISGHATRVLAPLGVDVAGRLTSRMFPEDWAQTQANLVSGLTNTAAKHGESAIDSMMRTLHAELEPMRTDAAQDNSLKRISVDFSDSTLLQWLRDDPALERQGVAIAFSGATTAAVRRSAQASAARAAARAGAAKGSVACAGAGPLAWVCVAGVFTGSLVVSELAILTVDEAMNRDDFEAMLLAEIERREIQMKETLRTSLTRGLSAQFRERRATINRQVRPIDLVFASEPPRKT